MTRWFLPERPDLLDMLGSHAVLTERAVVMVRDWVPGQTAAVAEQIDGVEHEGDRAKRAFRQALRSAFVTPVDAEDLYVLSEGLESILNGAKNLVREAEAMSMEPDPAINEMAAQLAAGIAHLRPALAGLGGDAEGAIHEADAASKCQRRLEKIYRQAMSAVLAESDLREVMGRRELYRRMVRLGDHLDAVAERVWYAVVKAE